MANKEVLNEIILGYRKVIEDRYQHHKLKEKYDLPDSFDEERVTLFREFFLDYIYPHPEQRVELDDAFDSLDGYIKNPKKLLPILMDSTRLLFKYGRHLPKILAAGIKALRSFRTATKFEDMLVAKAASSDLKPPYEIADINQIISELPRRDIEEFINNSESLFQTLYDRTLITKIKEIVEHLIANMKKRPLVFNPVDVKGMEIGRDIIVKGDLLFDQLSEADQKRIFDVIIKIERDVLDEIYG